MAPPALTDADHELVSWVIRNCQVEIDASRLAADLGLNPGAARKRWDRLKAKFLKSADTIMEEAEEGNKADAPVVARKRKAAAPKGASKAKAKGKGKGTTAKGEKKNSEEENDEDDDAEGEDDEPSREVKEENASPPKKIKTETE